MHVCINGSWTQRPSLVILSLYQVNHVSSLSMWDFRFVLYLPVSSFLKKTQFNMQRLQVDDSWNWISIKSNSPKSWEWAAHGLSVFSGLDQALSIRQGGRRPTMGDISLKFSSDIPQLSSKLFQFFPALTQISFSFPSVFSSKKLWVGSLL